MQTLEFRQSAPRHAAYPGCLLEFLRAPLESSWSTRFRILSAIKNQITRHFPNILLDLILRLNLREVHDRGGKAGFQRIVQERGIQNQPCRWFQPEADIAHAQDRVYARVTLAD